MISLQARRERSPGQYKPRNRVKHNQLDAQLILSIFRQPLHISGVSKSIIRRYNSMYEGESKSKAKIHLTALIEVTVRNFTYHFST